MMVKYTGAWTVTKLTERRHSEVVLAKLRERWPGGVPYPDDLRLEWMGGHFYYIDCSLPSFCLRDFDNSEWFEVRKWGYDLVLNIYKYSMLVTLISPETIDSLDRGRGR